MAKITSRGASEPTIQNNIGLKKRMRVQRREGALTYKRNREGT